MTKTEVVIKAFVYIRPFLASYTILSSYSGLTQALVVCLYQMAITQFSYIYHRNYSYLNEMWVVGPLTYSYLLLEKGSKPLLMYGLVALWALRVCFVNRSFVLDSKQWEAWSKSFQTYWLAFHIGFACVFMNVLPMTMSLPLQYSEGDLSIYDLFLVLTGLVSLGITPNHLGDLLFWWSIFGLTGNLNASIAGPVLFSTYSFFSYKLNYTT